jgi:hypothetical protein
MYDNRIIVVAVPNELQSRPEIHTSEAPSPY